MVFVNFIINNYKFSLITGDEIKNLEFNFQTPMDKVKTCCYDLKNNVIWGMAIEQNVSKSTLGSSSDKIEIICFFNNSAKPIVEYPITNEKYMPCSLERIISGVENQLSLKNLSERISLKTYQKERTLNLLGLEEETDEEYGMNSSINNIILKDKGQDLTLN